MIVSGSLAQFRLSPLLPQGVPARTIKPAVARGRVLKRRHDGERAADVRVVAEACPAQRARAHILSEELFHRAVRRERYRAARFEQQTMLVVVSADCGAGAAEWRTMMRALSAVVRDTDFVGWVERGSVLGILLTDVDEVSHALPQRVAMRLRRAADCVASGVAEDFRITARPLPPLTHPDRPEGTAVDALLLKLCARERPWGHELLKRIVDVMGSVTLLALLAPVIALVALLVKCTSPGPVLFRQVRVGRWGRSFTMLKFRTMRADADPAVHRAFVAGFIRPDSAKPGAAQPFKMANDPRVTRVGRFLRRSSLDELPQLWNVLVGQMSLVGPRPPVPYELEQYQAWHRRRVLEAKPGLTGLWQVTGRSRTSFDGMVRLDLQYVRTCSFWNDMRILLATPGAVISGKGAW